MHFPADIDGLNVKVAGHYVLVIRRSADAQEEKFIFTRLKDLAVKLVRMNNRFMWNWRMEDPRASMLAVSPRGLLMDLASLMGHGKALLDQALLCKHYPGYAPRNGPVHGIRCDGPGDGYSRRYLRRMSTIPERRLNDLVVKEDGEVKVRAKRAPGNIPNSYHDFSRERQRGWKSQHRGRKAWDRA